MIGIKQIIQDVMNKFGYEMRKKNPHTTYRWLVNERIGTVLDIGANRGQFTSRIRSLLPDAQIYAFEPVKSCFQVLKRTMRGVPGSACFNVALGEESGSRTIYRNDFTPSSSMLPMDERHKVAFPATRNDREEIVEVRRLDDVANSLNLTDNILIKVDVQGFEGPVIRGGEKTVRRSKIVIVETSFEPLYRGQLLFDGIYSMVTALGFVLSGAEEPLRDPKDGRILQCDSIFVRKRQSSYQLIQPDGA